MNVNIKVDAAQKRGKLEHSWRYIGYDECNYTYIPEGIELLDKFAKLGDGPYYFRTHFTFCTGNCHGTYKFGSTNLYSEDESGNPVYNYAYYDRIVDAYLQTGHKPFLELGFMPMDLVDTNYLRPVKGDWDRYGQYKDVGWTCPPKCYDKWHEMVVQLVRHLADRYGEQEVESWYFELWNEPDIFYWSGTAAEYCKLYDYTEHAVHSVLPGARVSGPAVTGIFAGGHAQTFFDFFLEHCKEGANFYSGQKGTQLDFITFHVKGGGFPFRVNAPKAVPSVRSLVHQVKLGLDSMKKYGYLDRELVLSEADPDGWAAGGVYDNANMIFRNTEYYATYVASTYDKIEKLCEAYGAVIRPLAWAFMFPGERCFEGTRTFTTQGIDKPVLNMFKIYGQLGEEKLYCESDCAHPYVAAKEPTTDAEKFDAATDPADVAAFAVQGKAGETQVVVYSHHDDRDVHTVSQVSLAIAGYGDQKGLTVKHYRIDDKHSNAHTRWLAEGSPLYPEKAQYEAIKACDGLEEFAPAAKVDSVGNTINLSFAMPAHGVSFVVISK